MATKGNATTTSTSARKVPTAKDNAKKPSAVKTVTTDAKGESAGATPGTSGSEALGGSPSPTAPDAVNQNAKLGGQTVEKLSEDRSGPAGEDDAEAEDAPAEPALRRKGGVVGDMRVDPPTEKLMIATHYTARIDLDFDPDSTDSVVFIHPAGWDVKAAVHGRSASGTFIVERARPMEFGFRVNGKKVASAKYEVDDGSRPRA